MTKAAIKEMDEFIDQKGRYLTYDELKTTLAFKQDEAWSKALVDKGYTIINIGNPNNIKEVSAFYEAEMLIIFGKKN